MVRDGPLIQVEVVYALPDIQIVVPMTVYEGTTAGDAVTRAGLLERFPEIGSSKASSQLGIFGTRVEWETLLMAGSRVEVYRPLLADPKEARRSRDAAQR